MKYPACQVCELGESVGVACSTLGAFSVSYCRQCLTEHAEPLWAVEATVDIIGGPQNLAEWIKQMSTFKDGQYIKIGDLYANPS